MCYLPRLCILIKMINSAAKFLAGCRDCEDDHLSELLNKSIEQHVLNLDEGLLEIESVIVEQAKTLNYYFFKIILTLCGYDININNGAEEIINELIR